VVALLKNRLLDVRRVLLLNRLLEVSIKKLKVAVPSVRLKKLFTIIDDASFASQVFTCIGNANILIITVPLGGPLK